MRLSLVYLALLGLVVAAVPGPASAQKPPKGLGEAKPNRPKNRPTGEDAPAVAAEAAAPAGGGSTMSGDDDRLYKCAKTRSTSRTRVTLRPETQLKDLVAWAMGFTCRNFIYGASIAGRSSAVTVITPAEMTYADAWRLFLVALQTMNLTVVQKGNALEIIESNAAKEQPLELFTKDAPSSDQIVRVIIRPTNISQEDLRGLLDALKSRNGIVTPVASSGSVIVTDTGNSVAKMIEVLKDVDQPSGADRLFLVRLKNADAEQLAQKLTDVFGTKQNMAGGGGAPSVSTSRNVRRPPTPGGESFAPQAQGMDQGGASGASGGAAVPTKILADTRSNALIIVASERAYAQMLPLIRRLDEDLAGGGDGRVHVYPLENAVAEELSTTLNQLLSGQQSTTTRQGAAGGARPQGNAAAPAPAAGGSSGGAAGSAFEGAVKVSHDKATNSLVVVSSFQDFLALKEVVRRLDIPRRQVFVEATILEVSLDKTRQMGFSFHGGKPQEIAGETALIYGGTGHSGLSSLTLNPASLLGAFGGIRGPEIENSQELIGISVPAFGVAFQFLQNNNDVNVLSSPHILTTDNEAAEMSVGQNIPYQGAVSNLGGFGATGGQNGQTGGFGLPFQSIQRQDVVLKLKITPHVNDSAYVRLDVELDISDIASRNFENLGPSWTKRTVKNSITVKDQEPVVIGGLMQDKQVLTESKVPLFGDIPVLGYLFKYQTKQKTKANLLIFLTPYIIHDQGDVRRIFEKKMRERREFVETFTAFKGAEYHPDIDYGKKRGLVEEINRSIQDAEEEERLRLEMLETRKWDDGPVEADPEPTPESAPTAAPESHTSVAPAKVVKPAAVKRAAKPVLRGRAAMLGGGR